MPVSWQTTEATSRSKALYGRYIDTKQWGKLSSIALPDAELRFFDLDGSLSHFGRTRLAFTSAQDCALFFHKLSGNAQTVHMFERGELEQIREDEVRAIWPMEDHIILRQGLLPVEVRGGGYYYETWRQKYDGWFLASLVLRRTYTKPSLLVHETKAWCRLRNQSLTAAARLTEASKPLSPQPIRDGFDVIKVVRLASMYDRRLARISVGQSRFAHRNCRQLDLILYKDKLDCAAKF